MLNWSFESTEPVACAIERQLDSHICTYIHMSKSSSSQPCSVVWAYDFVRPHGSSISTPIEGTCKVPPQSKSRQGNILDLTLLQSQLATQHEKQSKQKISSIVIHHHTQFSSWLPIHSKCWSDWTPHNSHSAGFLISSLTLPWAAWSPVSCAPSDKHKAYWESTLYN